MRPSGKRTDHTVAVRGVRSMLVSAYLLLCLLVAFLGRKRQIGMLGYFVISLVLTPLGGAVVLIMGWLLGAPPVDEKAG